jgi:hypothetical protein
LRAHSAENANERHKSTRTTYGAAQLLQARQNGRRALLQKRNNHHDVGIRGKRATVAVKKEKEKKEGKKDSNEE